MLSNKKLEALAIIPARGGSKGVPKKNITPLCGKPLIAWTIEAAQNAKLLSRFIVSTDNREIATIARKYGAEVPFLRPQKISRDTSTDIEFIVHALDFLKKHEDYEPDLLMRLAPTLPFRTAEHIDEGIRTITDDPEVDSVRAITDAPHHPYKVWKISANKRRIEPLVPRFVTRTEHPYDEPRQTMIRAYMHGIVDVTRTATVRKYGTVAGKKIGYFFVPQQAFIDIDTYADFELAEYYMRKKLYKKQK